MTPPAAAAYRSITGASLAGTGTDGYLLPAPELMQTSCASLRRSIDGTDNGCSLDRYIIAILIATTMFVVVSS